MGVRYDEFWYFTPNDLQPFVKAFEIQQKDYDTKMWILGQYIQLAVGSCLSDKQKYPDVPFHEHKEVTPENQMETLKDKFLAQMQLINSKFENKEDDDG